MTTPPSIDPLEALRIGRDAAAQVLSERKAALAGRRLSDKQAETLDTIWERVT